MLHGERGEIWISVRQPDCLDKYFDGQDRDGIYKPDWGALYIASVLSYLYSLEFPAAYSLSGLPCTVERE